jgi:hypothetical protein
MSDHPKWRDSSDARDIEIAREVLARRTDPRLELTVFVTSGVEAEVRQRLQAVAEELIELTGDVVLIQRYELAKVIYLDGTEHAPRP